MYHTLIDAEPINNCKIQSWDVSQFVLVWQPENELGDRTTLVAGTFSPSNTRCNTTTFMVIG